MTPIKEIIKEYIILNNGCLVHQDRMKIDGVLLGKEETKKSLKKIIASQREEFRKMVERKKRPLERIKETTGSVSGHSKGYNEAIDSIIEELE